MGIQTMNVMESLQEKILDIIRLNEEMDTEDVLNKASSLGGYEQIVRFLTSPENMTSPAKEVRRILVDSNRVKDGYVTIKEDERVPFAGLNASGDNSDLVKILFALAEKKRLKGKFKYSEEKVRKYLSADGCSEEELRHFLFLVAFLLDASLEDLEFLLRSGMLAQVNYRDMQETIFAAFLESGFSYKDAETAFEDYKIAVAEYAKNSREAQRIALLSLTCEKPKDVLRFIVETAVGERTSAMYYGDGKRYSGYAYYECISQFIAWTHKKGLTLEQVVEGYNYLTGKQIELEKRLSRIELFDLSHIIQLKQNEIDEFFMDMGAEPLDLYNRKEATVYYCLIHYEEVKAWYHKEKYPGIKKLTDLLMMEAYAVDVSNDYQSSKTGLPKDLSTTIIKRTAGTGFDSLDEAKIWIKQQVPNWVFFSGTSHTLMRQYRMLLENFLRSHQLTMINEAADLAEVTKDKKIIDEDYLDAAERALEATVSSIQFFLEPGSVEYTKLRNSLLFGSADAEKEKYIHKTKRKLSNLEHIIRRIEEEINFISDADLKCRAEEILKRTNDDIKRTAPSKAVVRAVPFAQGLFFENEEDLPKKEKTSVKKLVEEYFGALSGPLGPFLQYIPNEVASRPITKTDKKSHPRPQRILSELIRPTRWDFLFLVFLVFCDEKIVRKDDFDDQMLAREDYDGEKESSNDISDIIESFNEFVKEYFPDLPDVYLYPRCPMDVLLLSCLMFENPIAMLFGFLDYNASNAL